MKVFSLPGCPIPRLEWETWGWAMLEAARHFPPGRNCASLPKESSNFAPRAVAEINVILVQDGEMARLNETGLGITGPTNVLSFPCGPRSGDIYISVATLQREAALYGQSLSGYARRMLAHGLAHILGYEHGPAMDRLCERMLAEK